MFLSFCDLKVCNTQAASRQIGDDDDDDDDDDNDDDDDDDNDEDNDDSALIIQNDGTCFMHG